MTCKLCPRACGRSRTPENPGACGAREPAGVFRLGGIQLHYWEEPYISGPRPGGAGNLFFSGCSLGCCYCQNSEISQEGRGRLYTEEELLGAIESLRHQGAHTLCFVTAEHYTLALVPLLRKLRAAHFPLPIVWNTSSYQTISSLRLLEGLVDVYLPDLKYFSPVVADTLSRAPDYPAVAWAALGEMLRQQPYPLYSEEGILCKGVALRHLVLPGCSADSIALLQRLADDPVYRELPLALMAQYTPEFLNVERSHPTAQGEEKRVQALRRRITTYEYRRVAEAALELGFTNLLGQERTSAQVQYRPDFWQEDPLQREVSPEGL